jgi:hypothetical protein
MGTRQDQENVKIPDNRMVSLRTRVLCRTTAAILLRRVSVTSESVTAANQAIVDFRIGKPYWTL